MNTGQLAFDLEHAASHALDDFAVGEGNRLALAHVLAYPRWPHPLTLLVGPPKSGKSHLARIWAEAAGALHVGTETLDEAVARWETRPLAIEDVDRLPYREAALFHLLNMSMRDGRPVLMTARLPVSAWPYRTADVKSRARLATQFTLDADGDAELSQIFAKLWGDRQVSVDQKIIRYLLPRMERSPAEAAALVEIMDRLALARGTAVTRRIAAEALDERQRARGGAGGATEFGGGDDE